MNLTNPIQIRTIKGGRTVALRLGFLVYTLTHNWPYGTSCGKGLEFNMKHLVEIELNNIYQKIQTA